MSFFEIWSIWTETLRDLSLTLIGIGIGIGELYLAYRLIKHFIRYHAEYQDELAEQREQKRSNQKKVDDINRELDEIEATLNAVNPGDKVTPIWEIPTKKK